MRQLDGDQPRRIMPGFIISMAGLLDIPIGIAMALMLDQALDPTIGSILGLTVGQLIGLVMAAGGVFIFFVGRVMGWRPKVVETGSIVRR